MMESNGFPKCLKCESGLLLPLSDYGRDGAPIRYKVWVCSNPVHPTGAVTVPDRHPHPPIRPYGRALLPAPTGAESAAFDRTAIDELGVPQPVLMENAGRSAALVLQRLLPDGPVVGFVGSGNNGGDALVLLRTLAAWGRAVTAVVVADRDDDGLGHGWPLEAARGRDVVLVGGARSSRERCSWTGSWAPGCAGLPGTARPR